MASKVLFWYELRTVGEHYANIVRWCAYFGLEPIVIDRVGHFGKGPGPGRTTAYQNFAEAQEALADHQWVCLHPDGAEYLDTFAHPDDDTLTVYALGSDFTGFENKPVDALPGSTVKLRNPDAIYAFQVVPMLLYDRMLYLHGRRA
jgi:hypothetical protein